MDTSQIIKTLLKAQNLKYEDISKVLDITPRSFSNKLIKNNFTVEELKKICEYLQADLLIMSKDNQSYFITDNI